jgi:hypothetical protein
MASALLTYWRKQDACSETSVMTSKPTSINDLPDEILLEIMSYLCPEDLCFSIAEVCKNWSILVKDRTLWKTLSYRCDDFSDISQIAQVRCTTLLGFRTNWLTNFPPSSVLKVQNLKEHFRNWTSFHSEVRQVSRGLHCVMPSGCYW